MPTASSPPVQQWASNNPFRERVTANDSPQSNNSLSNPFLSRSESPASDSSSVQRSFSLSSSSKPLRPDTENILSLLMDLDKSSLNDDDSKIGNKQSGVSRSASISRSGGYRQLPRLESPDSDARQHPRHHMLRNPHSDEHINRSSSSRRAVSNSEKDEAFNRYGERGLSPRKPQSGLGRAPSTRNPSSNHRSQALRENNVGRVRSNSDSSALTDHAQKSSLSPRNRHPSSRRPRRDTSEEGRGHSSHHKSGHKSKSKSKGPGVPLDKIDMLDVTGLYGPGSFHHDGPFDACAPHRNGDKPLAPVAAFPADGPNNSLSLGPASNTVDNFMGGRDPQAYNDYSVTAANKQAIRPQVGLDMVDTQARADPVHGEASVGLGTSTFLDGAPAPPAGVRASMDRERRLRFGDDNGSGVGRTRSIVKKLRGKSQGDGNGNGNGYVSVGADAAPPYRSSEDKKVSIDESTIEMRRTVSHNDKAQGASSSGSGGGASSGSNSSNGGNSLLKRVKSLRVGRHH